MRIRRGDWPAYYFHSRKIVDVVAYIHYPHGIESALLYHACQRRRFIGDVAEDFDLEFLRPRNDNIINFRGKNHHPRTRLMKYIAAQAICSVTLHRLAPILKNIDAVIGHHSVEIEHDEVEFGEARQFTPMSRTTRHDESDLEDVTATIP